MFRDTFDPAEWSAVYDSEASSHYPFRHGSELALSECRRIAKPCETWADVGSGTGYVAAALAQNGQRTTGIDHDPAMLKAASQRYASLIQSGNLRFVSGTADHLPFEDESVDGIIATSFMGCLASPAVFYREAFRILKPGRPLILTFTNRSSLLLRVNARLRKGPRDNFHLYEARQVRVDLKQAGFQLQKLRFYNIFVNPGTRIVPPLSIALALERLGTIPPMSILARNFLTVAVKTL